MTAKRSIVLGGVVALYMGVGFIFAPGTYAADDNSLENQVDDSAMVESQRGFPSRGLSSKSVISAFGEPLSRSGPVGNPPISKWSYEGFSVFFEDDLVITTVSAEDRLPTQIKEIQ
jgi:hypothetical protein